MFSDLRKTVNRNFMGHKFNFVRNLYLKQALHNDKNYNIVQTLMFILIASFITALHLSDTKWNVSAVKVEK